MADHNELGREGEDEALLYLTQKGYTLLARNWRIGHLEIDIVAEWFGEIVFVEVKTRRDEHFAPAAEAVTLHKSAISLPPATPIWHITICLVRLTATTSLRWLASKGLFALPICAMPTTRRRCGNNACINATLKYEH